MPSRKTVISSRAFSLVELLVSMVVLVILGLVVLAIIDSTMRVTSLSDRRISADSGARLILDRIGSDFDLSLQRSDLPDLIEKKTGNDSIVFFAQATGYDGDRGISQIGYTVSDQVLNRGVLGTSWTESPDAMDLKFGTTTTTDIPSDKYEIVASDVFRFEIAFLMADGKIYRSADKLISDANTPADKKVRALIVGLVALDRKARNTLPNQDISSLSILYPDAIDGQDLLQRWGGIQLPGTLPDSVRNSVRIYQRYFYLKN